MHEVAISCSQAQLAAAIAEIERLKVPIFDCDCADAKLDHDIARLQAQLAAANAEIDRLKVYVHTMIWILLVLLFARSS